MKISQITKNENLQRILRLEDWETVEQDKNTLSDQVFKLRYGIPKHLTAKGISKVNDLLAAYKKNLNDQCRFEEENEGIQFVDFEELRKYSNTWHKKKQYLEFEKIDTKLHLKLEKSFISMNLDQIKSLLDVHLDGCGDFFAEQLNVKEIYFK